MSDGEGKDRAMSESRRTAALRPDAPVPLAAISFFPAFTPPRSGGEMRCGRLYARLARLGFDVRLVSATFPFVEPETVRHGERFVEYRVPKGMAHHRLHQVMRRGLRQGECSATVVAMGLRWHQEFLRRAREAITRSRVVVFEYPLPVGPLLRGIDMRNRLLVYNAYNVESALLHETSDNAFGHALAAWTAHHERRLARRADVILACSHEDADELARRFRLDPTKITIAPNGVETDRVRPVALDDYAAVKEARRALGFAEERPLALFLGSQHPPNIGAARFLCEVVAPSTPGADFAIAGSVCEHLGEVVVPANVRLFGRFEEEQKPLLMQSACVAVNPIFSGSGTNLKMLEFFAAGLPVVSTRTGARGLAVEDGRHLRLAERGEFADVLGNLIADEESRKRLGHAARNLAEERYDWDRIAEDEADVLHHKTHRRLLVLNDYPVSPVSTGGTVRLYHHYREVSSTANVTILTQTKDAGYRRRVLAPGLEEINVPEGGLRRVGRKVLYGLLGVAADDLVCYLTVGRCGRARRAFARESRLARAIVLSHPFMAPLVRRVRDTPIVYESHNVETHLKEQTYGAGFWARWGIERVRACERLAIGRARFLAACSAENIESFRDLFPREVERLERTAVVPNGVACAAHPDLSPEERTALKRRAGLPNGPAAIFLASGHPPNVEAARFVIEELAPASPSVTFLVLGGVCWPFHHAPRGENVLLFYEQDEAVKNRLLAAADIALNTLTTGSGISLKALDYLAAGCAVISTPVGIRGIAVENGRDAVICNLDEMHQHVERLAGDAEGRHRLGESGRRLARERYDWSVTTKAFVTAIEPWLKEDR